MTKGQGKTYPVTSLPKFVNAERKTHQYIKSEYQDRVIDKSPRPYLLAQQSQYTLWQTHEEGWAQGDLVYHFVFLPPETCVFFVNPLIFSSDANQGFQPKDKVMTNEIQLLGYR